MLRVVFNGYPAEFGIGNRCQLDMEVYADAKPDWMDKLSNDIKLSDTNMWHKINNILKGNSTKVVQPIRLTNREYTFCDKEISNRLKAVHIDRVHASTENFDETWRNTAATRWITTLTLMRTKSNLPSA
jgi:hypothetical protein